ncbi:hypothetical protein [uncultured Actinomyces sp.]|uniref:hypothetical protein n=1 Tax=uncultured Actinomyces sp. TaxID=249061 RepID=UPI0026267575|nr:hypothetical protein [uncultured Actinomyces sp.]
MKKTVITIVCVIVGALVATAAIVFGLVPLIGPNACESGDTACENADDPVSPSPSPSRDPAVAYKPVLYVYPEREQSLTVFLDVEGELGTVYPAPDEQVVADGHTRASWSVTASPDGTLTDEGGRTYPSLFWDGKMTLEAPQQGFIVARADAVPFLEEKLALLGLTDKEAADFITFWAPQIRANEYTFVSFDASSYASQATYSFTDEAGAPIEPDAFIRVFMTIRAADANEVVTPQLFGPTPTRSGFTVVEWGGTEQQKSHR